MPKYLTQEWLDLQKELSQAFPEKPNATARMQYMITGGPDGDVAFFQVIEDGKMLEAALGTDAKAEFTMSQTYDDAVKILKGELDANAAFMQGRIKVTGNMGKLMSLMPLTQSPEYKTIQNDVAAQTEF